MHVGPETKQGLEQAEGIVLLGPRTAARGPNFEIEIPLPPTIEGLDVLISRVESIRPNTETSLNSGGKIKKYREHLETEDTVLEVTQAGEPVLVCSGNLHYLAGWLDQSAMQRVLQGLFQRAGISTISMPEGVRRRETKTELFWFNHSTERQQIEGIELQPMSVQRHLK